MTRLGEKFYRILKLEKSFHLIYGRPIVKKWCEDYIHTKPSQTVRILDVGCGVGDDLANLNNINDFSELELYGIECSPDYIEQACKRGILVSSLNIERERFPFKDDFFDVIILNQIIEHTKEIFWIFSEISRVVKKGGIVIVGFPNLAAFHNRIWLFFGEQPSAIELFGPHVRGYTAPGFKRFIENGDFFEVIEITGSHFWPMPFEKPAMMLSKIFPRMAVSLFFLIKRQNKTGTFIDTLREHSFQTPYFKG